MRLLIGEEPLLAHRARLLWQPYWPVSRRWGGVPVAGIAIEIGTRPLARAQPLVVRPRTRGYDHLTAAMT